MEKTALLRLHFIVFLWGFTAILGKLISMESQGLVFYRMLLASVFLFVFLRLVKKQSIAISRKVFFQLAGIGGIMATHWLFFFESIKVSNVSIALSCLSIATISAALLEPLVYKRKIDRSEIAMGMVIMGCIYMIFQTEFQYRLGVIYGAIAAMLGAVFSVLNGRMYGKTSSGNIIFYEIFCGWLLVCLFYLFTGDFSTFKEISFRDLTLVTLLASVFTAYPMFESIRLMKYITPFTLVLTVNLEPVYGIILAYFIFQDSEHMSPLFYIASLVMVLAIIANGVIKARKKQRT